jgi:type IV pilus assembly protein PilB
MATTIPAVQPENTSTLSGVARALVLAGKLTEETADAIHQQARAQRKNFIAQLTESGTVSASDLAHILSQAFAAPLIDLAVVDPMRLRQDLLEPKLCKDCQVLPLSRRNGRLLIATADPSNEEAIEQIRFQTQASVDWIVAEYDKLTQLIAAQVSAYLAPSPSASATATSGNPSGPVEAPDFGDLDAALAASVTEVAEDDGDSLDSTKFNAGDVPVVRFLNKMLLDAINMKASDLHFEPYEFSYRVRYRVDGELREIASPPPAIKEALASRIKVLARLDIAEKRVPQDGRMKLRVGADRVIDFRVSTLPTLFGEKIVIRILDPSSARMGVEALGYEPEEKQRLLDAIGRPYGMILVTGPTGSGKTVSLYACLNLLNKPGVNISTAEDPSEINMPGINQVNVSDKAGLTFAAALRAFLRQDPDIIMVGEIRDLETADIAIKAAQTGHLVLSTLHTNDAPATLTRMRNMGIAPFNIASGVILITAQRLARRLCPKCRTPVNLPPEALIEAGYHEDELDGSWTPYGPVGCSACNNGYKGRVGIYQVMPISEAIQRIILADGSSLEIAEQARAEGVRSLRESGLLKVRQGVTSLEEILAVTNE